MGAACFAEVSLHLDPLLFTIIVDNLVSNALKYGGAKPPHLALKIEPLEDCAVSLTLTCRKQGHSRAIEDEFGGAR